MQKRLGLDLEVPDAFGYLLVGLTIGEGCFAARIRHHKKSSRYSLDLSYEIALRADDKAALEYIRVVLGIGKVYTYKAKAKDNPMAYYIVRPIADLYHVIVPLFEKYPIPRQFKKARDFDVWGKIVEIHYHQGGHRALGSAIGGKALGWAPLPQSYWDKIEPLVEKLKRARTFAEQNSRS